MAWAKGSERGFEDLLKEDLKTRSYKNVYVFDGPDTFRIESVVERLQTDALDAASAAFNVHCFHGDQCGWPQVLQQAASYPMLGVRQLVRVKHVDRMAKDDAGEAALLAYFANPMPTTILVLTSAKMDRRRGWVQNARKKGYFVDFAAPQGAQLDAWVRKAAQRAKLELADDVLRTLVDLVGGDLQTLSHEIEKLSLLSETWGRQPTADDVANAVMDQAELAAFAITDVLKQGQPVAALRTWQQLRGWGHDCQGLAPLVLSHLRRTALVAALTHEREAPSAIISSTRINAWLIRTKLAPDAQAHIADGGRRLLAAATACERTMKRSPVPPSLAFESLLLAATLAPTKGES